MRPRGGLPAYVPGRRSVHATTGVKAGLTSSSIALSQKRNTPVRCCTSGSSADPPRRTTRNCPIASEISPENSSAIGRI